MKKYIYLFISVLFSSPAAYAQQNMDSVLKSIESRNKTLRAESRLHQTRQLEAHTGNYLANPTVELNQLWADRSAGGNVNELAVVQSFDFPTVYANKNKLADLKATASGYQYAVSRQQILLSAQQLCIEIIYLHKQKKLAEERAANARHLFELYQKRLEQGDANQLELNKIQLEQLNAQNTLRLNRIAIESAQEQLQNLNGGEAIAFRAEEYPEMPALPAYPQIESEYMALDPGLKEMAGQSEMAEREIRLTRAMTLPKFDIGYRRNGGSGESMNGFRVGMSIPLWENKNTVKKAKAQFEYTTAVMEDRVQSLKSSLKQLYQQVQTLSESREEYRKILSGQPNIELLNKAIEAGQISIIEYFTEVTTFYESRQNAIEVEREYFNALAQLFQYKL